MAPSPEFMQDVWVRKMFCTTGHTLLVYDYFLTLKDEVCYIWNRPWTIVKVMFLINRYGNLIGQTFIRLEEAGLLSHGSQVSRFIFLLSNCSHAYVGHLGTQKRVAKILIWSYAFYILVLTGTAMYGATIPIQFAQLDVTHICIGTAPILFVSTMRCLRIYSREFQSLYPSDLLHILFRDAIVFFIKKKRTAYADNPKCFIAKAFSTPIVSVAGQRLVLNLRGSEGRTYSTRDLSREVDRQLEAFAAADSPCRDDMGHPESGEK
ncbi:uncharacterized protein BJ212DRAFT_1303995 [Suillus subaureus]|uniref:DUF6533 domain-containing protein n=1 Tax=Suillus subaureus TaxID=48587 RepID=A0A9P7J6T8_9AGAM|nr:uncharacterized protein BJ212DRAFT_1303995 [Suillus subaureus]KAG1805536.1 hypothetical protein BJ212DRAFT_1303995 [Suillus subaureus]